jgi:hypothetical protein
MTKNEGTPWNNRVWDDQPCCWNCDCNGARWKQVSTYAYCGFSTWSGGTNQNGNHQFATYALYAKGSNAAKLSAGQGGPGSGYTDQEISTADWTSSSVQEEHFFGVHLTETGANLLLDGVIVHSIALEPGDSEYRFGCATYTQNSGYTDLRYHFGAY